VAVAVMARAEVLAALAALVATEADEDLRAAHLA